MKHFIEHLLGVCGEAHINIYHVLVIAVFIHLAYTIRKRKKV
mgnify:CR=1 FL=1|jgi:hypothetical protein